MNLPDDEACECVGYTIRTDYGTGVEHDVDQSSCPIHGGDTHLPDDEAADLTKILWAYRLMHATTDDVIAHVADLCHSYQARGYVMGDLAHDGTLKAQAEAEEQ